MNSYWTIFAQEVPSDMGISLTEAQVKYLADAIEGAVENMSMYCGYEAIPDPQTEEIKALKNALKEEREKVHCKTCNGNGSITSPVGPCRSATSQCWKCRGEGRHKP